MDNDTNKLDEQSSLLSQLQNKLKKGALKETTTKTTFPDGSVQYSIQQGSSLCQKQGSEKSCGFVVDEKPDLTIGQVKPWLFISSQDVANDPKLLKSFRITHILSLLPGFKLTEDANALIDKHLTLELYDDVLYNLDSTLRKDAYEFIENAKSSRGKVLVHCNAGISRAPSVVIAYLIERENLSLEKALEIVRSTRPSVKPNEGFLKQLKKLDSNL